MVHADNHSEGFSQQIRTILIAEDDTAIGDFLVLALKTETPYQSIYVSDGVQALEAVKTLVPDLFILDYQLPQMNGLEIYDHFHSIEEFKDIPVLLMSANAPIQEIAKRRIYSIKKPFDLTELLQKIEELLSGDDN